MTRVEIQARALTCIHAMGAGRRLVSEPDADTGLNSDFWLNGRGFLRLGELLEEEFSISIGCDDLIDLALNAKPTLGHLVELIQEKLDDA